MLNFIKKIIYHYRKSREESLFNKYENINIGSGTQYSLDNLDGIAPHLIYIGEDCIIAPRAVILTHDACLLPTTGKYIFKRVHIGSRVFIGYGAVIMPGIVIGDNVIIGSNSVITKNIPSDSVVVGAPGRLIGKTSELAERRKADLISPVFNWRNSISLEDIIRQQKELSKHFDYADNK